jgi:hypothetical protein
VLAVALGASLALTGCGQGGAADDDTPKTPADVQDLFAPEAPQASCADVVRDVDNVGKNNQSRYLDKEIEIINNVDFNGDGKLDKQDEVVVPIFDSAQSPDTFLFGDSVAAPLMENFPGKEINSDSVKDASRIAMANRCINPTLGVSSLNAAANLHVQGTVNGYPVDFIASDAVSSKNGKKTFLDAWKGPEEQIDTWIDQTLNDPVEAYALQEEVAKLNTILGNLAVEYVENPQSVYNLHADVNQNAMANVDGEDPIPSISRNDLQENEAALVYHVKNLKGNPDKGCQTVNMAWNVKDQRPEWVEKKYYECNVPEPEEVPEETAVQPPSGGNTTPARTNPTDKPTPPVPTPTPTPDAKDGTQNPISSGDPAAGAASDVKEPTETGSSEGKGEKSGTEFQPEDPGFNSES